jgi:acetyltransferase-like isoleucine patch superfamily enzyme
MAKSSFVRRFPGVRIHATATIEDGVRIGPGSSVWDNVHIRRNTVIGRSCIVGEKTYIAYDVRIGDFVKINAFVYIPTGVTVEDKVMISAGCIFINDKTPRAFDYRKNEPLSSAPNEETLETRVKEGATVGAAATVLGGLEIGRFALVGAGSVVTRSVPDHALVVGNPARQIGWVCVCGRRFKFSKNTAQCRCGESFKKGRKGIRRR